MLPVRGCGRRQIRAELFQLFEDSLKLKNDLVQAVKSRSRLMVDAQNELIK